MNLTNSKMTAKEIYQDIGKNFANYTVGVSYFEKIKGKDNLSIGDEFAIVGGPSYRTSDVADFNKRYPGNTFVENHKNQINEKAGTMHWAEISTGVTVKSTSSFDIGAFKGYSFTFSTWEGHVEAGEITFSVTQFGKDGENPYITFNITSKTRSSNFLTDKFYRFLGGYDEQTKHWETFLENLKKTTGASSTGTNKTTEKSETPIQEIEQPVIKERTN
jgi:hypothetical protein